MLAAAGTSCSPHWCVVATSFLLLAAACPYPKRAFPGICKQTPLPLRRCTPTNCHPSAAASVSRSLPPSPPPSLLRCRWNYGVTAPRRSPQHAAVANPQLTSSADCVDVDVASQVESSGGRWYSQPVNRWHILEPPACVCLPAGHCSVPEPRRLPRGAAGLFTRRHPPAMGRPRCRHRTAAPCGRAASAAVGLAHRLARLPDLCRPRLHAAVQQLQLPLLPEVRGAACQALHCRAGATSRLKRPSAHPPACLPPWRSGAPTCEAGRFLEAWAQDAPLKPRAFDSHATATLHGVAGGRGG